MKFEQFVKANKPLAMVITIDEYKSIRSILANFYTEEQLKSIDGHGKFNTSDDTFLLRNPYEARRFITPMMYLNAITFIERIPFSKIDFESEKGTTMKYTVGIPYKGWKYYEVEAENEEAAKNKVFEENDVPENISLCWSCSDNLDSELELQENDICVERE